MGVNVNTVSSIISASGEHAIHILRSKGVGTHPHHKFAVLFHLPSLDLNVHYSTHSYFYLFYRPTRSSIISASGRRT